MEHKIICQFTLNGTEQQTLIEAYRMLREICNTVNDCKQCPLKLIKCGEHCCIFTAFAKAVSVLTDF